MYLLKGFVTHALLADNAPGVIAPVGEISTQSLTYAREKGLYRSDYMPNLTLYSFSCIKDNAQVVVENTIVEQVLGIAKFVYDKAIAEAVYIDELLQQLTVQFAGQAENFACGELVEFGESSAPAWLSWNNTSIDGLGDNTIRIWLADQSFQSQYDEFEILVVPPFDALDDFFKTGSQVKALVEAITPTDAMLRVQNAKNAHPETTIRAETFDWVDPYNANNKIPVVWHLIIYGAAGNNSDAISDALVNYILAHSARPRTDWLKIFPDIFRRTEFTMVPLWDQYAIPNRVVESGIYSPILWLQRGVNLIKSLLGSESPYLAGTHLDDSLCVMGHPYKSLQVLVVGGPDNRNNWFKITDVFSDYIAVSSTSIDFNRMRQATKDWANALAEMLVVAERMTETSSVPLGMSRVKRGEVLYLSKNINNITYLVAAKASLPTVITGE